MLHRILILLTLGLVGHGPAWAQDEEQKFLNFLTAMAIDEKCHFLRRFELAQSYSVSSLLLDDLPWAAAHESGKIAEDEYAAEYARVQTGAQTIASAIPCSNQQAAAAYILPLRAELANPIYANLLVAFKLGQLTPEQQEAARRYEAMVAPIFGQNWPNFVQHAQMTARILLDTARDADGQNNIYGFGLFSDGTSYSDYNWLYEDGEDPFAATTWNFDLQVSASVRVIDEILFEMVAENQGYRYIEQREAGRSGYIRSLTDATFTPVGDLFEGPARYPTLEGGAEIHAAMVIRSDGQVRVMTYGQGAANLKDGSVVIMVQPEDAGELSGDYQHLMSQQWWDGAKAFRGEAVPEPCLGGPCFALSADIVETLLKSPTNQQFRFYFSERPDVPSPSSNDPAIRNGYGYQLGARRDYLAAGP